MDYPPLVYHPRESDVELKYVSGKFHEYRETLPKERRVILDRYHIVEVARKVVGVGSVGTPCGVALLMAGEHDPMLLQIKDDLTGIFCTSRSEREFTLKESWYADEEIQAGADRNGFKLWSTWSATTSARS